MYCRNQIKGKIITPKNPLYNEARKEKIQYFDYYPAAIVYVVDYDDIRCCLQWAKCENLKIRIRCGGHSFEGYSMANGALIIDVSELKSFKIDTNRGLIKIGSGLTLEEIYSKVASYGFQFSGGTCPTVGISGLVSGGGVGLSSRLYGLTCDNLVEAKMIDLDGKLITANDKQNSDLFWAIRGGGGGNFGILVEFTFTVYPVDKITYIAIGIGNKEIPQAIKATQAFSATADKRVSLNLAVNNIEGQPPAILIGYAYTSPEEAKCILLKYFDLKKATSITISEMKFIDAINIVAKDYTSLTNYKTTGGYVNVPWGDEAINALLKVLKKVPPNVEYAIGFNTLGGVVSDYSSNDMAYNFRTALVLIFYNIVWVDESVTEEAIKFVEEIRLALLPYTSGVYVNQIDRYIENYLEEYYGQNLYKLRQIRCRYNKTNLLNFPQIIK